MSAWKSRASGTAAGPRYPCVAAWSRSRAASICPWTERWPGTTSPRPFREGESCRILVDGRPVITGYVDDVAIRYDDKDHAVSVSGRDRTADLVDCSAPSVQWAGRSLPQVAAELCRPFGIGVRTLCDCAQTFQRLKNTEGDSVFETLEAAARVRARTPDHGRLGQPDPEPGGKPEDGPDPVPGRKYSDLRRHALHARPLLGLHGQGPGRGLGHLGRRGPRPRPRERPKTPACPVIAP
jgi:hypothetical protein